MVGKIPISGLFRLVRAIFRAEYNNQKTRNDLVLIRNGCMTNQGVSVTSVLQKRNTLVTTFTLSVTGV
jgi:hypothetical protein